MTGGDASDLRGVPPDEMSVEMVALSHEGRGPGSSRLILGGGEAGL